MRRNRLLALITGVLVVCISYVISPYYSEGDQSSYNKAYSNVKNLDLVDAFYIYRSNVTTEEPMHFFIIWFFSHHLLLEKNIVMSFANGFLAFIFIIVALNLGASIVLAIIIVLSNYYFFVFYFAAERLKFGIIFMFLAMLYSEKKLFSYMFSSLSVLSHLQMILFYVSKRFELLILLFISPSFKIRFNLKSILISLLVILGIVSLGFFLKDYFFWKVPQYISKFSIKSIWQTSFFMLLACFYSKNILRVVLFFIPLIVSSAIVGPERIVFISYFFFLYYAVQNNRGINLGVAFTVIYFSVKSCLFLYNIITTGQGFN